MSESNTHQFFNSRAIPKTAERTKESVYRDVEKVLKQYGASFEPWVTLERYCNYLNDCWHTEGWRDYFRRTALDRVIREASLQVWNEVFQTKGGLSGNLKKAENAADTSMTEFEKKFR